MKTVVKECVSFLIRFGVSGALLYYLFQKADIQKTWDVVKEANIAYLGLALVLTFVIYGILLFRWRVVMRQVQLKISLSSVVQWFLIGNFFNLFLPTSSGGDIVKTIGLCQNTQDRAKVVASVLLDRVFGFIAIILVAFVSYFVARQVAQDRVLLTLIVLLFLFSWGGFLFLLNERLYAWACGLFNAFPMIKEKLLKLHQAIVLVRGRYCFIASVILLSCGAQILLGLTYFLTAKALHQDVDFVYCMAFSPLICVASALPSIGGLGFRDFGSVFLFTKIGMTAAAAMSLSLINFLYVVIIGLIGAIVYVGSLSHRRV